MSVKQKQKDLICKKRGEKQIKFHILKLCSNPRKKLIKMRKGKKTIGIVIEQK